MDFNRESFIFHNDWYYAISRLDDELRLELYDAIMRKAFFNEPPLLSSMANLAMSFIEPQIERDFDRWLDIREKRSNSGKLHKGNQYNKLEQTEQKKTNGTSVPNVPTLEQNGTNGTNGTVNVNVNVDVNKDNIVDFVERMYKLYPSKCPVRNISTGKCSKDKKRIEGLLKLHSMEDIERVIKEEVKNKLGKHPLKNFSTFLNNFPDPNDMFAESNAGYPQSIDDLKDDDNMPTFNYFIDWAYNKCQNLWNNLKGFPEKEEQYQRLVQHTVGGTKGLCYVMLVLNRDGWEKYNDERGLMFIYSNYIKANGMFKK